MAQILKPSDLSLIWASAGDALDPGTTKYATGWTVEIPPLQTFNYLDSRQDQAIAHINQHGVPVWDAATEYQEDKSYVQGSNNGTIYRCVQTHTNQDPETDVSNTYWVIAFASAGDFYTKTETNNLYLAKASNGSDIPNAATFRSNIDVYQTTQVYTKTEVDAKTTVASTAQAQAGTSNTVLMTPLRTTEWATARESAKRYTSTQQTMTAGGLITLSHGLGVEPFMYTFKLICTVDDLGYTAGQVVLLNPGVSSTNTSTGIGVRVSNTQIVTRVGSAGIQIVRGDTGAISNITLSSWRLVVGAQA